MPEKDVCFSIIIPTYNRAEQLVNCLTAIKNQADYPLNFEVIIVNDGGEPLDTVIDSYKKLLLIKVINQKNMGPAQARNQGAAVAVGNFLVFTDDDCCPASDWLYQLAKIGAAYPEALIGGQTVNHLSNNICSTASQLIVDVAYQYYNLQPEKSQFFASNNMMFPRLCFLKIGGFHPDFRTSEDREICDRWLNSGFDMVYTSAVKIYHAHALTLQSFWQQHFSYGQGAFNYHTIRTQRGAPPFKPDLKFYGQLFMYPFQRAPFYKAVALAFLMGLSQLASAIGYFSAKSRFSKDSEKFSRKLMPLGQDIYSN